MAIFIWFMIFLKQNIRYQLCFTIILNAFQERSLNTLEKKLKNKK